MAATDIDELCRARLPCTLDCGRAGERGSSNANPGGGLSAKLRTAWSR